MKLRSGAIMTLESDTNNTDGHHGNHTTTMPEEKSMEKHSPNEVTLFGRKFNTIILLVHSNICLYAVCFWIQIGTLPYLSKKLGADPVVFGYLQTVFAVVQLAGGPIFGRFGDLYGGRAALTLAFSSAALTYGLMSVSVNVPMLFLSRTPSIFMHAMQAGQMVVTDLGDSSLRADALGKLGLSYGIGMVIGPFIGGILTKQYSEEFAASVACVGSLLSIVICLYFVPKKTKKAAVQEKQEASGTAVFSIKKFASLMKHPRAVLLLSIKAISGIPIGIFQAMFSVVAMETFKLGPDENGYIMSYIGVLSMITQGMGIGYLMKSMSEMTIIKASAFILVWSYLMLAFIGSVFQLCVVLVPMCVGLTLMNVVISSALTHTVSDADTGAMLGLNMAVNSFIRTLSPTVGGYMLTSLGFSSFGYLGFINNLLITAYLLMRRAE